MLTNRAMEILNSADVIDVTYKNNEIWIESINQQENMAQIKDLKTSRTTEVPIAELQEGQHW